MSSETSSLPPRPPALERAAHKGDAGRVVVLAGSRQMPGAALLAVGGALRGGAGLVTLGCLDAALMGLLPTVRPEALLWDLSARYLRGAELLGDGLVERGADVVLCGPGIGRRERGRRLVDALLTGWSGPLVLDADALTLCAGDDALLEHLRAHGAAQPTVLTPHPGEAAALLAGLGDKPATHGDLKHDQDARRAAALRLADALGAIVCLKGAGTVVARAEDTWTNPSGNPGMASGGTGDVLAGCMAAYLVGHGKADPFDLARAAVYVHGLAGDRVAARLGRRALLAGDLLDELGPAETEGPWSG